MKKDHTRRFTCLEETIKSNKKGQAGLRDLQRIITAEEFLLLPLPHLPLSFNQTGKRKHLINKFLVKKIYYWFKSMCTPDHHIMCFFFFPLCWIYSIPTHTKLPP